MLLYNPENGATIRAVWIYDKLYFSDKTQEEFKPGDIVDVEEKVGEYLKKTYEFLEEVSAIRAKNIIEKRAEKKFVCDKCSFEAKNEVGLVAHRRTHESVVEGVRVVKPIEEQIKEIKEIDPLSKIDSEARGAGLIGEGLVQERV